MTETIISVRNVHKSFKNVHALQGVNFDVAKGTIVGLLGPNGAGKTTLVRILTTLIPPDQGEAIITGLDVTKEAAKVSPITVTVNSVRAFSLHLALGDNLWQAFIWIGGILLLFVPFAVYTYTKRST